VTGGAGNIGSHTCVELVNTGHDIVVVDDLSNSSIEMIDKIKKITGRNFFFYEESLLNKAAIKNIFSENKIDAVIHFAGFKAVGESVEKPLKYYGNNLISTIFLCEIMSEYNCKNIVFSSSATVYAPSEIMPLTEEAPLKAYNPYGRTKFMIEEILNDLYYSDPDWNITILRARLYPCCRFSERACAIYR
jgi:UDP-glucose 4-epimerase